MKDKNKKIIFIVAGLAISAVLIALIATSLKQPEVEDVEIPTESSVSQEVTPETPDIQTTEKENEVTPDPIEVEPTDEPEPTNGDDEGTKQSIQPDPEPTPEYTEEQLTDPTQTPDGEPVTPPTEENPTPPQTQDPPAQPTQPSNPTGGLPGFDNVPDMGDSTNEYVDGMVENGNKVGTMD